MQIRKIQTENLMPKHGKNQMCIGNRGKRLLLCHSTCWLMLKRKDAVPMPPDNNIVERLLRSACAKNTHVQSWTSLGRKTALFILTKQNMMMRPGGQQKTFTCRNTSLRQLPTEVLRAGFPSEVNKVNTRNGIGMTKAWPSSCGLIMK